jgi:voltage-gated potassium channel
MDLKMKLRSIIFGIDTPAGKRYDVILILVIIGSLLVVMLDSVQRIHQEYGPELNDFEWFFTIIFTLEYIARVYSAKNPWKYIFSFYGVIDLLSTLPSYLALFFDGGQTIMVLRVFRLMRVFRVFKLGHYITGSQVLINSLYANRGKIIAFLTMVLIIVIFIGSLMYIIEGPKNGFTSIPKSMYWAIVTVTTVGFGDISPKTGLGQFLASILMLIGYSIIAVPTGIVSSSVLYKNDVDKLKVVDDAVTDLKNCERCKTAANSNEDNYCWKCGAPID